MVKIKIIAGSTRPGRFNIQPARWITEIAKARTDIETELLDLAEINLPFMDEPELPMQHKYSKEHTKKWAAKIGEADGFVFVTPEYNHSISPVLKNAVDYLFQEWNFKPGRVRELRIACWRLARGGASPRRGGGTQDI